MVVSDSMGWNAVASIQEPTVQVNSPSATPGTSSIHTGWLPITLTGSVSAIQRQNWKFLVTDSSDAPMHHWIAWPPVFYFSFRTIQLLAESSPAASENLQAIQMRGFLDEVAPALRESQLYLRMNANPNSTGAALTLAILDDVEDLTRLLKNDFKDRSFQK